MFLDKNQQLDRWVALILVLLTAGRIFLSCTATLTDLTFRVSDDAFYYYQVAHNIVSGNGMTFDGINQTNGFHPLWMGILIPVFFIFRGNIEIATRAVLCLGTLIAGGSFWAAYRAGTGLAGRKAAIIGISLLFFPLFLNPLVNGLETGLLILLLFAMIYLCQQKDLLSLRSGFSKNILLGTVLALIFLCRLDTIFIVLSVLGLVIVRAVISFDDANKVRQLGIKLFQTGMVLVFFCLPYFYWNYSAFGHIMPISGAIKTTFPTISLGHISEVMHYSKILALAEIIFSSAIIIWTIASKNQLDEQKPEQATLSIGSRNDILLALWVGSIIHFLYTLFFMNWGVQWWHYAAYGPVAILSAGLVFARIHLMTNYSLRVFAGAVAIVLTFSFCGLYFDSFMRGERNKNWHKAAAWARTSLPENAVIGMHDCGLFGYFCGRTTINLDGVINGYEYQMALKNHKLTEYLRKCGITHIADYETIYREGVRIIKLPARLYGLPGGAIKVTPAGEAYRSDPYSDHVSRIKGEPIRFILWDVEKVEIIDDVQTITENSTNKERKNG